MEEVAVKSGYYFEIFTKDKLPKDVDKSPYKVELDRKIYDLYKGTTWLAEENINELFEAEGKGMGYILGKHLVKEDN